jgi:ferric-dicitrate binding protein FerR (iron transport regulator)
VRVFLIVVLGAMLAGISAAWADDWTAVRLRGVVMELVNGGWERLERRDVVPDDRVIRTGNGRVTFVRGEETIELGANTQIQIFDQPRSRPYTTVRQYFGEVSIEAEVKDVEHFAVQTPYMVAAVKGTRFTVSSDEDSSEVRVRRGAVAVESTADGAHTLVVAGQSASAGGGRGLEVAGEGDLPNVLGPDGKPIKDKKDGKGKKDAGDKKEKKDKKDKKESNNSGPGGGGSDNSGSGGSGHGGGGIGHGGHGSG